MSKKWLGISTGFFVITACSGYALGASAPLALDNSQTFYGCVTGVNGNITKVSNSPKVCPRGTSSISWNNAGPAGPAGPKGDKGDRGDSGKDGQSGGSSANPVFIVFENSGRKVPIGLDGILPYMNQGFQLNDAGEFEAKTLTYILFDQAGCSGRTFATAVQPAGFALSERMSDRIFATSNTEMDWKTLKSIWVSDKQTRAVWALNQFFLYWEPDYEKNPDEYILDTGFGSQNGGRCVNFDMSRVLQYFLGHYNPVARSQVESEITRGFREVTYLTDKNSLPSLGPWHYEFSEITY